MSDQCPRRFDCAMAVGVGFDDRHDLATGGENPTKLRKIMCERRQIYGGDGWEECRRNRHAKKRTIRKSNSDLHDFLFLFLDELVDLLPVLLDQLLSLLLGLAQFILGKFCIFFGVF